MSRWDLTLPRADTGAPEAGRVPRSRMDHPRNRRVEGAAGRGASRLDSPRRAVLTTAVAGWLAIALLLVILGEVLVHSGLLAGLRTWDDSVNRWFVLRRTEGRNSLSSFWSKSAETVPIIVGALLLEVILAVRRRWRDLLVIVVGLAIELAGFLAVNEIVRRQRPDVAKLGAEPSTFSFPSGHTAATVVLWGSVALLLVPAASPTIVRVLRWFLVVALTGMVGWARVYRGMHHVTDVVAGMLLGLSSLLIAITAARASSMVPHQAEGGVRSTTQRREVDR